MHKPRNWQALGLSTAAFVFTLAGALLCTSPIVAAAAPLGEVVQAALAHDARLSVAKAERSQSVAKKAQADAIWRPQVMLGATVGVARQDNAMNGAQFTAPGFGTSSGVDFATSVNGGTMSRVTLGMVQPLLAPALKAGQAQLQAAAQLGDLAWDAAQSQVILGTTQQYWELALAQEKVRLLQSQQSALLRQQEEAQDRFKLGASPITDTYEANAALAQVKAQVAAALLDVKVRQQALSDSTRLPTLQAELPGASTLSALPASSLEAALQQARQSNKGFAMQRLSVEIAQEALRKAEAASGPRVDLVAEAAYERLKGSGDFGQASNKATRAMVGVQAHWALYSGGMAQAQALEAANAVEVEQAKLAQTTQTLEQEVRQLWWSFEAEHSRLQALQQASTASAARTDATLLGRQVGDRTQLDVLNAQTAHMAVALSLAQVKVALALLPLQLKAQLGQLDAASR